MSRASLDDRLPRQPLALGLAQEGAREIRHVLEPLAQRRQADRHDVEAVEEILAEAALVDQRAQVLVRRRDDADVGGLQLAPADAGELALLQDAEQPRLGVERHVADLVEEQRPAAGLLELARPSPGRRR